MSESRVPPLQTPDLGSDPSPQLPEDTQEALDRFDRFLAHIERVAPDLVKTDVYTDWKSGGNRIQRFIRFLQVLPIVGGLGPVSIPKACQEATQLHEEVKAGAVTSTEAIGVIQASVSEIVQMISPLLQNRFQSVVLFSALEFTDPPDLWLGMRYLDFFFNFSKALASVMQES
jgi:hypothetical protein